MSLARMLDRRAAEGRPIRVGLIGAGKFGSMFLAQARVRVITSYSIHYTKLYE